MMLNSYRVFVGLAGAIWLFCQASGAFAGTDYGRSAPLTAQALTDEGEDFSPALAHDGGSTWVVVWDSTDAGLGLTGGGAVFSRSTDGGSTWSTPAIVRPEFASHPNGEQASVTTDPNGTWVIAWIPSTARIDVTVSTDNGASWGVPQTIATATGSLPAVVETDGSGVWIIVWSSADSLGGTIGFDPDILISRSTDDGATWSAPAPLNTDAAVDTRPDGWIRLASDGTGTWIAVWEADGDMAMESHSTDDGLTWSPPFELSATLTGDSLDPDIESDGNDRWVAVWSYEETSGGFSVVSTVSDDDGSTWSVPAPISSYFQPVYRGYIERPRVASISSDEWQIVWESDDRLRGSLGGSDSDILTSYSRDGGTTWSSPAALSVSLRRDGGLEDYEPVLEVAPTGRAVSVWSKGDFVDVPGIDQDIHFVTSDRDCDAIAREDCRKSTRPDGSRLTVRDAGSGADRLVWRLKAAQATSDANLGNPAGTDNYVLCLYEKVGTSPGLIAEWDAKAGTTCGNQSCWSVESGVVELRDASLEQGSIKRLKLNSGADGEASLRLTASGPALAPPRLPLDVTSPVRIQLVNLGTNICWEGVHDQADKNDSARFSSTSD